MALEGKEFSHYRILRLIGKGGMGEVYLTEDTQVQRQVAAKVIQMEDGQLDQKAISNVLRLFWREASVIAKLDYPTILPLYDHGETILDGLHFAYLIIPYRPEGSLVNWIRQQRQIQPLTSQQIVHVIQQAGEALQYAHDHQVMHLDIKPANFLVRNRSQTDEYPDLLLSDFGIARLATATASFSQNVRGTPIYMAPEQCLGQPTFASDQYALAVMAYELLTGNPPFQGTPMSVMFAHLNTQPEPASQRNPLISSTVNLVLQRALAKKPEERFPSISSFARAFQEAFSGALGETSHSVSSSLLQASLIVSASDEDGQVTLAPNSSVIAPPDPISFSALSRTQASLPSTISATLSPPTPRQNLSKRKVVLLLLIILLLIAVTGGSYAYTTVMIPHQQAIAVTQRDATATARIAPTVTVKAANEAYASYVATHGIMFGFDAEHTRNNPYERIISVANVSQLRQKWAVLVSQLPVPGQIGGGSIASSPVVANSLVYIGSPDGHLYAFDAFTGKQKWVAPTGAYIHSSPAVANGLVYVGCGNNNLYAFDALTGKQKWVAPTGYFIYFSSPVVADGVVYIGSEDGKLYAFDALTGKQKWAAPTGNAIAASPAVADGVVYIGSKDGKLYAFDALTGKQKWVAPTGNAIYSSPAVADGVVYIGSRDNKLYAFDVANGKQKWVSPPARGLRGFIDPSPAVANGVVYAGSGDDNLYAFDAATGKQKWAAPTRGYVNSSAMLANGVVYVGSADGKLYAFDAATGKQKWAAPTGNAIDWSSPVVANGVVYVGSADHKLYAFSLA